MKIDTPGGIMPLYDVHVDKTAPETEVRFRAATTGGEEAVITFNRAEFTNMVADAYPFPSIQGIVNRLKGATVKLEQARMRHYEANLRLGGISEVLPGSQPLFTPLRELALADESRRDAVAILEGIVAEHDTDD